MKITILDAATMGADIDLSVFEEFGTLEIYNVTSREDVVKRIKGQDVVITNKVVLDSDSLQKAAGLKLICVTATGTNNIDIDTAKTLGIAVCNAAGYSTVSVVQHTFASLFYILENLKFYDNYVLCGEYTRSGLFTNIERPFLELDKKVWGIIGLGNIGRGVADIASSFGCKIIYYSTQGVARSDRYEMVTLEALLGTSDIVSIHSPLNDRTQSLMTHRELTMMKSSAYLLNMGRGGIVNEKDLAEAIDNGIIAGAAVDVLAAEPMSPDNPLNKINKRDRLLITPHIAWASVEARNRLVDEVRENILSYLTGGMRNRV